MRMLWTFAVLCIVHHPLHCAAQQRVLTDTELKAAYCYGVFNAQINSLNGTWGGPCKRAEKGEHVLPRSLRRLPLPRHPLRLCDLLGGHLGGHLIALDCPLDGVYCISCKRRTRRSQVEPHIGLHIVLRHAFALLIHQPEFNLRGVVPLLGRLAPPRDGLHVVLQHAFALLVLQPEEGLRAGVAPIGGLAKPDESLNSLQFSLIFAPLPSKS
jgi:hypothetical protein